jgi:hypothetical protein
MGHRSEQLEARWQCVVFVLFFGPVWTRTRLSHTVGMTTVCADFRLVPARAITFLSLSLASYCPEECRLMGLVGTDVSKERITSIISVPRLVVAANVVHSSPILVNLMMEAIRSSDTSVRTGIHSVTSQRLHYS